MNNKSDCNVCKHRRKILDSRVINDGPDETSYYCVFDRFLFEKTNHPTNCKYYEFDPQNIGKYPGGKQG